MKLLPLLLSVSLAAGANLNGQDDLVSSASALSCSFSKPAGRHISFVCEIEGIQKSFPDRVVKSGFIPETHLLLTLTHSSEEPVLCGAWTPKQLASEEMETVFISACPEAIDRKFPDFLGRDNLDFSYGIRCFLKERFSIKNQELEGTVFTYDPKNRILIVKAKPRHINVLTTFLDAIKQKPVSQSSTGIEDSEEWDLPHARIKESEELAEKFRDIVLNISSLFDEAPAPASPENFFKHLEELGKKCDKSGKGVKIEVRSWPGTKRILPSKSDDEEEKISSESKNENAEVPLAPSMGMVVDSVPLGEAIGYTCRAFTLKFRLSEDKVIIGPLDMPLSPFETVRHQFGEGSESRFLGFMFRWEAPKWDENRPHKIRGAKYDYDAATRTATFTDVPENLREIEYAICALDTAWCPALATRTPQMEADIRKLKGRPVLVKGVIKKLSATPAKGEFFSPYCIIIESIEDMEAARTAEMIPQMIETFPN